MSKHDTLRIRCDAKLKADLDALAARENRSMSNLALHVLSQYIQAHAAPDPLRETPPPYGQPAPAATPSIPAPPVSYRKPKKRASRGHVE